jgi:hypothetical protein
VLYWGDSIVLWQLYTLLISLANAHLPLPSFPGHPAGNFSSHNNVFTLKGPFLSSRRALCQEGQMLRFIINLLGLSLFLAGCARGSGTDGTSSTGGRLVSVNTNRAVYAPDDAIAVTVHNALTVPIYAMDTQASCSILALHYQVNGIWQPSQVAQCPQKRPARPVKIDAGATYTATITAGYPGLTQLAFPKGSYRLVLTYTTSPDAIPSTNADVMVVTSPTFQVQ